MTKRSCYLLGAATAIAVILFLVMRSNAQVSYLPPPPPGDPQACVNSTVTTGSSIAYLRADSSPALCSNISPNLSGNWTFSGSITFLGSTSLPSGTTVGGASIPASPLTGTTGSIGGGLLLAGGCATGTATVTGASPGMPALAAGLLDAGAGTTISATVTASNTVTVRVCALLSITPVSTTYSIRVFP